MSTMTTMMKSIAIAAILLGACVDDSDPRWQLDHDRVIAVRASPPRIASGDRATLDALIAHVGAPTTIDVPDAVAADNPALAAAVQPDGSVIAPDGAALAVARQAMGLAADAPVPLRVTTTFGAGAGAMIATKTIYLGATGDNPATPAPTIDGAPIGDDAIAVPIAVDVPLAVAVGRAWEVAWLSSCGTLHDDDLADAVLRVAADDPQAGELAVVVRDDRGGVAWRVWPIAAAP